MLIYAILLLTCSLPSHAKDLDWPELKPGSKVELRGQGPIPKSLLEILGNQFPYFCADGVNSETQEIYEPITVLFKTANGRSFSVISCSVIHNDRTMVFELVDGAYVKQLFAAGEQTGFGAFDFLDNATVDEKTGSLESYRREAACDESGEDQLSVYQLAPEGQRPHYILTEVSEKSCLGGEWKIIWEAK